MGACDVAKLEYGFKWELPKWMMISSIVGVDGINIPHLFPHLPFELSP